MKIALVFLVLIYSSGATACFVQPEGLAEQHESTFLSMLGLSAVLCILILCVRVLSDKKRLWVPIICLLFAGYIPMSMYILFMEGIAGPGGACGRPILIDIGQVLLVSLSIILGYETFNCWRSKRSNGL